MGIYERLGRKRPAPKGANAPPTTEAAPPITTPAASASLAGLLAAKKGMAVAAPQPAPETPPPAKAPVTLLKKEATSPAATTSDAASSGARKSVAGLLAAKRGATTPAPGAATPDKAGPLSSSVHAVPKPLGVNQALQRELAQLLMDDNYAQIAIRDVMKRLKLKSAEDVRKRAEMPEVRKIKELDDKRIKRLKEIFKQFGWPGKSLVGEQGSHEVWLLVQHADHDRTFQKEALRLMGEAVAKKEVSQKDFAYLTDRVRCGENQRQVYGTQLHTTGGEPVPKPIEDEANVDKRRKSVGLAPMKDYLRQAREEYKRRHR